MVLSATAWRGKQVLITGHTGFKGAWLSRLLQNLGARVVGYSLAEPPSSPSLFELAGLRRQVSVHLEGDVRNFDDVCAAISTHEPVVVFHLAAQALVREGYRDPMGTYATNVMGTVNVLEAVRRTPSVRAAVVCTSDKCYENSGTNSRPFVETDALGGHDPYSASKAAAEMVVAAYQGSQSEKPDAARVASVRAGNVIGGGDFAADRLICDLVRHWLSGASTPIRNPNAIRPWQHVLEPLTGYVMVAEALLAGTGAAEAWNFGPGEADSKPVSWIADRLCEIIRGARWIPDAGSHPREAHTLRLDSTKAMTKLGWKPKWNIDAALERTGNWYQAWRNGESALDLIDADIGAHR